MRGITDVSAGTVQVKSAKGGKVRSAPRGGNSSYLDIFLLNVERIRLNQEQANLNKRRSHIDARMERNQKKLDEIRAQMQLMGQCIQEKEAEEVSGSRPKVRLPSKRWQTMPAEY